MAVWRKAYFSDFRNVPYGRDITVKLDLAIALSKKVQESGGRALVVGGFVRDLVMHQVGYEGAAKDIDLEVFGLDEKVLRTLLEEFAQGKGGPIDQIGKSFGVYKIGGLDVALARQEQRTGPGRGRKPETSSHPELDFAQAAKRRDLTMNALGLDLLTGEIFDAYGGVEDIQNRVLRHVDSETFGDDPLRVYRVMQFAARFGYTVAPETLKSCQKIPLDLLAAERIGDEWEKMLTKSLKPSVGLQTAYDLGILRQRHQELERLHDASTGTVGGWGAMLRALDMAAAIARKEDLSVERAKRLLYAVVFHALAARDDGAVEDLSVTFLKEIKLPTSLVAAVRLLAENQGVTRDLMRVAGKKDWSVDQDRALRHLAFNLGKFNSGLVVEDAVLFAWAVQVGTLRPGSAKTSGLLEENLAGERLLKRAKALKVSAGPPKCILSGSDLAELGVPNGPMMGVLLQRVFEEQLAGAFDGPKKLPVKELAMAYAKKILND